MVFSLLQRKIIQYITDAKLKKANVRDLTWSLAVLYDKERLEMGLSTANIAYADMVQAKKQVQKELQDLDKRYQK